MPAALLTPPAPAPAFALPFRSLWRTSPPLVLSATAMGVMAVVCLVGLAVDPRELLGVPVWVKPLKFCISSALYVLTLAALLAPLRRPRLVAVVGYGVGLIIAAEVVLIGVQAARGVASHFNVGTPFDAAVFAVMGVMIAALWVLTLVAAVALLRTPQADRVWRAATAWGLALALAGGAVSYLMTMPTPEQAAGFATAPPQVVGAHTVGAPDGGPGLPFVGWSRTGGDLRVPHFFGLHGLQAIPLLALALARLGRLSERQRRRLVHVGGALYLGGLAVLLQQALRGQPLLAPDAWTFGLGATILFGAALATLLTFRPSSR